MNKTNVVGIIVACIGFTAFLFLFTSGSNTPIWLLPNEALQGLAFSFAWGLGLPEALAYLLAILLMLAVFYGFFRVGKRIMQLLTRS